MIAGNFLRDLRREWRLAIADRAVPLSMSIIGMLTLLAMLAGWLRVEQRREFQETLRDENLLQQSFLESAFSENETGGFADDELSATLIDRKFQLQMSAQSPDLMRYTGGIWWAISPASPLASLSMGSSEKWTDHYHHNGTSKAKTLKRSNRSNPLLATVGAFDLTLLVGAILPLAFIVLTYHIVASDREHDRWSLVGLHARSIPRLIVVRCLVRIGALTITVLVLTAIWTVVAESREMDVATIRNFFIWAVWLIAYSTFWGSLAVAVNSFRLSSSGAGLLLLLGWTVVVIAIPSLVQREVNQDFEVPSQSDLIAKEEHIQQKAELESEQIWRSFLEQNSEITIDRENPQQEYLLRDIAVNRAVRSRVDQLINEYHQRFLDRESRLDRLQILSPLLAWRTAADQSAGTSLRHFVDFAEQTSEFHNQYIRYFEPFSVAGEQLTLADIRTIPKFDAEGLQSRVHSMPLFLSAISMIVWSAIFGLLGWWSFRTRILQ